MSLLDMLKSLLGLGPCRKRRSRQRDVGVTVEHQPGDVEPETATEDAVKGTEISAEPKPGAAQRESGRRTGSTAESDDAVEIPDAEESASDSGAAPEHESDADEAVEIPDAEEISGAAGGSGAEAESEPTGAEPDVEPEAADEPTDVIKGIGNTYAERLADAGVETVGDLAAADPAELAEVADVSESRLERWVARARDR